MAIIQVIERPPAAAQAMEQAIAKKPDGIVVCLWGPGMIPAIKEARSQGIPVICTEAYLPDSGVFTYIGLDNYACGRDTAIELIKRAGTEGNYVMQGNWGASNTEAKLAGFLGNTPISPYIAPKKFPVTPSRELL